MKVHRGEKGTFSGRGRIMQLTGWAENKSQVHIYTADACSESAERPRET